MYNENDFIEIKGQLRKIILLAVLIALAFIVTAVAFLLRKPQWIGAVFISIGACLFITITTVI